MPEGVVLEGLIALAFKFLEAVHIDSKESRKSFFANHIEPSYIQFSAIHKDYLKSFSQMLKIKEKGKKTDAEMREWVKERQVEFSPARVRIKYLEPEVFNNKYFTKAFKKDSPLADHTKQYLTSLVEYFEHYDRLPMSTWYNYMIHFIREAGEKDGIEDKLSRTVGEIKKTIEYITAQFEITTKAYSKIRSICLQ